MTTFNDGLINVVANLGTSRDKLAATVYDGNVITDAEAVNAYRSAWLPRKIVDVPALDSMRQWRSWQADADQISAIEAEEKRLALQPKLLEALTLARLTGGAAVYIGTGDSNPSEPLQPERIGRGGIRHLTVIPRIALSAGDIDRDPESGRYGLPSYYRMTSTAGSVDIHPSRLVILMGAKRPASQFYGVDDGWGDSVLASVMDEIKRADSTAANVASLVFEAKIDVVSIPDLMNSLREPAYEADLLNRLRLAMTAKGVNGTLILDATEKYDQKNASFASLRDIMGAFYQSVAGAADIPIVRLLGESPGGLNSSGEVDLRNYYDKIRSMQELELSPAIALLDECLIRSALGERPAEIFYNWRSLWQTSEKERAEIGKLTAETIKIINEAGLIDPNALARAAVNMLTEAGVMPGLENEYNVTESGLGESDDPA